jgi:tetrahydromethanopterin S-methyltransferase subunit G
MNLLMADQNVATRLDHIDKRLDNMDAIFIEVRDVMVSNATLTERLINNVNELNKTNQRVDNLDKKVTANRDQILKWCGALGLITTLGIGTVVKVIIGS